MDTSEESWQHPDLFHILGSCILIMESCTVVDDGEMEGR